MLRFALAGLLAVLAGCATKTSWVTLEEYREPLIGFYYGEADGERLLYVIGERHEYVFADNPAFTLATEQGLLKHVLATEAYFKGKDTLEGRYRLILDAQQSDKEALEAFAAQQGGALIVRTLQTPDASMLSAIRSRHPQWSETQPVLSLSFISEGKIVQLANRDALLAQYRLQHPIPATVTVGEWQEKISVSDTLENIGVVAIVPMAIVAAPFVIAADCLDDSPNSFISFCPID